MQLNKFQLVSFIIILLILTVGCILYFFPTGFSFLSSNGPQRVDGFPSSANFIQGGIFDIPQVVTVKRYQLTRCSSIYGKDDLNGCNGDGYIIFTDLQTQETHQIHEDIISSYLGDGFGVWVARYKDPLGGISSEFNVRAYNFATKKEELLLERFNNNHNGNGASIAASGRKIALTSFANKLILIDFDTKEHEEIDMMPGYRISYEPIIYMGSQIIVGAGKTGDYNSSALIKYDLNSKKFDKIYEPGSSRVSELKATDSGEIYWKETEGWSPTKFYRLKIQ